MIKYNMRYRGSLEYEKFVLNILQFHNIITDLYNREFKDPTTNVSNLLDLSQKISLMYDSVVGKETIIGSSESFYLKMLDMKEC